MPNPKKKYSGKSSIPSIHNKNTEIMVSSSEVTEPSQKKVKMDPYSIFTLFKRGRHEVNWYVYRSKKIRDILHGLWDGGPKVKSSLKDATQEQIISTRTNALFEELKEQGPCPENYRAGITLDKIHGKCNRPDLNCVSKGFYHTHVSDGRLSFVVMWEAFEDKKLINIVALESHENFDFKRKHHDPILSMEDAMEAAEKAGFSPDAQSTSVGYKLK